MRSLWVALIMLFLSSSVAYNQEVDSLMQLLPLTSGSDRIEVLHQLTVKTWLNYPDDAIKYAREAYKLSVRLDDRSNISKSLRLIGGVHYYKGNYDSVLFYSNQSLKIANVLHDTVLINNAYNNIGLAYYNMGSYQNALENLLRSLNMKIAVGEVYGRSLTLNNIGLVYNKLKDYEKAREYFTNALNVARQTKDANLVLYSQNNIGFTYLKQEDLATAKEYFERSLQLDVDNKNWTAVAYSGLGQVYQQQEEYDKSRDYFARSLELRKEIGERNGISEIYYYYAREEQRKNNYEKALELLNRSQSIANEIGSKERMFENFSLYVELFKQKGDIEKAFEYQTRLLELRDTLFNETLAHNLATIHLKIQEEESQKLLEKKEHQLEMNRRFNVFLVIILVLATLLAALVLYAYNNNRRINGILAERNAEIMAQKEEIEAQKESLVTKNIQLERAHVLITEQNEKLAKYNTQLQNKVEERTMELEMRNEELKLANLELDNFLYKSSHDIKGPLATLMGICNVAMMDTSDPQSLKYFSMLAETAQGLNEILARLKTVSDINSLELKFKKIDFAGIIEKCIKQIQNIEGIEDVNIEYAVDKNIRYLSDPLLIDLIFFNMIQNAVKFKSSEEESIVKISVDNEPKNIIIHFMDNGIGIRQEDAKDIFQMFSKTALQHQTLGLGLYIVKQSVQKLGGDIMLLNDNGGYTHFRIVLPIV